MVARHLSIDEQVARTARALPPPSPQMYRYIKVEVWMVETMYHQWVHGNRVCAQQQIVATAAYGSHPEVFKGTRA